jgi:hypothetical protein
LSGEGVMQNLQFFYALARIGAVTFLYVRLRFGGVGFCTRCLEAR